MQSTNLVVPQDSVSITKKTPNEKIHYVNQFSNSPYSSCVWKKFNLDTNGKSSPKTVEAPEFWSDRAVSIVSQKYFRGKGDKQEDSVKQIISRVVDRITEWAREQEYFDSEISLLNWSNDLTYLLIHQYGTFNSPVWFNIGVDGELQQAGACYLNSVEDSIDSISKLQTIETLIFKQGSGTGTNYSTLRSSKEQLSNGGYASGPVSFMKAYDAWAGGVKSGGKIRRAAKIAILNVDHPDIMEFINCKVKEERKAKVLVEAGYNARFDDQEGAYYSLAFQNTNHSVRVTDDFMIKVEKLVKYGEDSDWELKAVTTRETIETIKVSTLWKAICEATHICGDPGIQFDTTTNKWNTCKESGRINCTNPCIVGETLINTSIGLVEIKKLEQMCVKGKPLPLAVSFANQLVIRKINKVWMSKETDNLIEIHTKNKVVIKCTPEHRFMLEDGSYLEAKDLKNGLKLKGTKCVHNIGTMLKKDSIEKIKSLKLEKPIPVYDISIEDTNNFSIHVENGNGIISHNCGETTLLDDSACNLSCLNIRKFEKSMYSKDILNIDTDKLKKAVTCFLIAQEAMVSKSYYPTDKIKENSIKFRPLGMGVTNLGGYLMANAIPYNSEEGRNKISEIMNYVTAFAYHTSAQLAKAVGSFSEFELNKASMMDVIQMHANAAKIAASHSLDTWIWENVIEEGKKYGFRNSQVTLLQPCGTVSFMLDSETTGIEPEFMLKKVKSLAGGGELKLDSRIIKTALENIRRLKYPQVQQILQHFEEHGKIKDAPVLTQEEKNIFACSMGDDIVLPPSAHVSMVAAVQPFISGAISKTVNAPVSITTEEISKIYLDAWKMGVKNITVYRDKSKEYQPINETRKEENTLTKITHRKKLPDPRPALNKKFSIDGTEGYLTVGLYQNGMPGEIFFNGLKEGSLLSGLLDSFAIAFSLALQYGADLSILLSKFENVQFKPSGWTPEGEYANSIVDWVAKWMKKQFLQKIGENTESSFQDFERCTCGGRLIPSGPSCKICSSCGDGGSCG